MGDGVLHNKYCTSKEFNTLANIAQASLIYRARSQSGKASPESEIEPLRQLKASLSEVNESPISELPDFAGVQTDNSAMQDYLQDATNLRDAITELGKMAINAVQLSESLAPLLRNGGDRSNTAQLAQAYSTAKRQFDQARLNYEQHSKGKLNKGSITEQAEELDGAIKEAVHTDNWARWVDIREKAQKRGLTPLIEALQAGTISDSTAEFKIAYFTWWLHLALDANPSLREFAHWTHSDQIEKFRELDTQAQELAAEQINLAIVHELPVRDAVARKSELGTLRHQMGLKRPSLSIRDLISQMPETMAKLAPCVLMSPLSVAQYLPTNHEQFDLVIFDEASQITTWDAIGAIARGKQSIIVGDPKQLPPTNFFGRAEVDDEDIAIHEKDLPSILEEAVAAGLPTCQLNWHYRSRDESLIAFSNHHYYGNRLVTFPSPSRDADAITYHAVSGTYARGTSRTNINEARAIAKHIVTQLEAWLKLPESDRPTLGVITFNIQQQELILDLLDSERRAKPTLEWFFSEDREEPLIVKNLENIQGDERDVMLFSITFGKDQAGKMTMNFGAINNDGGEKRLNVAVTRARAELHIFTSITSEYIDLSRTKARGPADLKNFLDYAKRGAIALPAMDKGSLGPAENPFEESIKLALETKGWEVRTQIGISGFRIDLAVVHPDHAGAYLAGVECDGATYHSSVSARDRDKIREAVLRNIGWEILRVWSTDWFKKPQQAIERIDKDLRELLAADRNKKTEEPAPNETQQPTRPAKISSNAAPTTTPPEQEAPKADSNTEREPFSLYEETFPDPTTLSGNALKTILQMIIDLDGPLPRESVYDQYRKNSEIKKIGKLIRASIDEQLTNLIATGLVCVDSEDSTQDPDKTILRSPSCPKIKPRPAGQRDLFDIPPTEIAQAMAKLFEHTETRDEETILRSTIHHYGRKKLTASARIVLMDAYRLWVK